ncbi:MAG TPA: hypothetical protein PKN18_10130 [Pseudomonadales bacterium]|nr:hypothetical protein [Pseudomonadales bacterium]
MSALPTAADAKRGFDHGVFIPFKLILPEADLPIVQLSLRDTLDAEQHLRAGRALAALRREGVLLVGSGMATTTCAASGIGSNRFPICSMVG